MIIGGCAGSFSGGISGRRDSDCIRITGRSSSDHRQFPLYRYARRKAVLRGDCRNLKFPPQVTADIASFEDLQGIMDDLKEYCSDSHYDLKTILSSPFTLVTPNSKNCINRCM